ncbi:MAG: RDD family protein, partial [Phycisphaerales bacterium]|nr:RDD family protein [Phycisphaerales bacterium]
LVLVLVVSLFVVLRPVPERDAITLPAGWALATPGRRFVATALDLFICALPVSRALGVPMRQIFTAGVLLDTGDAWVAIPAIFAVGLVYGTITETLFAGTIGKRVIGCRVLRVGSRVEAEPQRLGPASCFIRNLIKWVLPPVAALAALEPSGRHRGDLIARAVVVVPIVPQEEDSADNHT